MKKVKVTLSTGRQIEVLPVEIEGLKQAGLLKDAPKKEDKTGAKTKEDKTTAKTK